MSFNADYTLDKAFKQSNGPFTTAKLGLSGDELLHANKLWFAMAVAQQYGAYEQITDRETVTVGDIRGMDLAGLAALTTSAWEASVLPVPDDQVIPVEDMFDPVSEDEQSMVSSEKESQAFAKYKIGFRSDTRDANAILKDGFVAKYQLNKAILDTIQPGLHDWVADTYISTGMFINRKNQDFFNETGICVSRSFHGATKFPEPGYEGVAYLFAIRVTEGADTEVWQRKQGGVAPWRPGEKALARVDPKNILAWLPFKKAKPNLEAAEAKQPFFYYTLDQAGWRFTGNCLDAEKEFLNREVEDILGKEQTYFRGEDFVLPN